VALARHRAGFVVGLVLAAVLATLVVAPLSGLIVGMAAGPGKVRTYYIAVDEVEWDYAPLGYNAITGEPFGEEENVFVANGPYTIGSVYVKALYREYTDATFTSLKPRPPEWEHLGALGPLLFAEVGDTIIVEFRNHARFPFTLHPHGVFYQKDSEGAPYADGTSGADKEDDGVPSGGSHTYVWPVPERAGPGPMEGSSILWMYHSHVDEPGDTNAGLVGPIVVAKKGAARTDGRPSDVHRQFVTMFTVFDENRSPYLMENIETYILQKWWPKITAAQKASLLESLLEDEAFAESNLMHSINGYVFGNLPGLDMYLGERVRWYALGMGTEVDLHTPHWHGNTLVWMGARTDVIELLPASMKTLDMIADNPGTWLYHCHVNDHIDAGMLALFRVS